ncbi:MAG: divergent polysaccharide deacetylase family protein [Pseudomonadota bacterium]
MAKGFSKGVLWGAVVSVSALALISVAENRDALLQERLSVDRTSQDKSRAQGSGPSGSGLGGSDAAPPEPDTLAGLLPDTLAPAAVPQAGTASDLAGAAEPADGALTGITAPLTEAPRVTYTDTSSLKTPATEPGVSIATEPVQPAAPDPVPQSSAFAVPEQPATPEVQSGSAGVVSHGGEISEQPDSAGQIPTVALDPAQPALPGIDTETSGFGAALAPEIAAQPADAAGQEQVAHPLPKAEDAPTTPEVAPETVASASPVQPFAEQVIPATPPPAHPEKDAPEAAGEVFELPVPVKPAQETEAGESGSARVAAELSIATPKADAVQEGEGAIVAQVTEAAPALQVTDALPDLSADLLAVVPEPVEQTAEPAARPSTEDAGSASVRVNRLPTLDAAAPIPDASAADATDEVSDAPERTDLPPIERFAAVFDNPENKPLMTVILIDDGVDIPALPTGLSAIQQLPHPVSFAVDALLPDAADRMRTYRAAGFEVLAMVDLPEGARAADAEVSLSVALDAMPEVVGVLDGVRTGIQTSPDAGRQVAQILAQTGHGLVTQNRGLNTVQKLAARQGVPSAVVFRDFDAKGQSSVVIRRFLDHAAFRAGQEGKVIMLGRLREETLAALVVWALQDRASSVAMAPVSAALTLGR